MGKGEGSMGRRVGRAKVGEEREKVGKNWKEN